ncbi:MAG: methylmalonyl-CoA mutase, partial [Bacteroidia bacterium]|nr:methylmalonyl-CoA mutase [Bacteroidia bacterium]
SYFVEELTNQIEAAAWEYITKIDGMGGAVSAIEEGYMQKEIAAASYQYQKDIENNSKVIIGVNKYTANEEIAPPLFKVDDSIRKIQTEKIAHVKANRNEADVQALLIKLEQQAKDGSNVMPTIIESVEAYATLGEVADVFRKTFGEYRA